MASGGLAATLLLLLSLAGIITQFILLSNLPFFPFLIGHAYCQTLSFRSVEDDRNTTETITSITTVSATYNTSTGELCADGINNDLANSMCREFSLQYIQSLTSQTPAFNGKQNYLVMFCILNCF